MIDVLMQRTHSTLRSARDVRFENGQTFIFIHFCRYITILYFLNDVKEGGETAFPIAENGTFNRQVRVFDTVEGLCPNSLFFNGTK